jgi:hypothetical protein
MIDLMTLMSLVNTVTFKVKNLCSVFQVIKTILHCVKLFTKSQKSKQMQSKLSDSVYLLQLASKCQYVPPSAAGTVIHCLRRNMDWNDVPSSSCPLRSSEYYAIWKQEFGSCN